MPLPLLFIIPAVVTGAVGIGKGIKAGIDINDANYINNKANSKVNTAKDNLEAARKISGKALENLGEKKLFILDKSINNFVKVFEQIHNIDLEESKGLEELSKFKIDKQSFAELKELGSYASSILGGTASGAVGGALTAFGAWSAAGTFATASTGTAIAGLSGAAATNATLAFFGGGSLAAGGLGMAGGAAVLGGLVAGPALAVVGFIVGAKASQQRDEAYSNLAQAEKIAEELNTAKCLCDAIKKRANLFYYLLIRLDSVFSPLVYELENILKSSGNDYKKYSDDQKKTVAAALAWAGTIKAILDTPILTEDGSLTEESENICNDINKKLEL